MRIEWWKRWWFYTTKLQEVVKVKRLQNALKSCRSEREAVILQPSNPDIDPEEMRKNAKENQVGILVVIGGDGTIHHAVQNFKDTIRDYQIGIIQVEQSIILHVC